MARPVKCRKVCCMPARKQFGPLEGGTESHSVAMTLEEYETIRLIDYEGFTQERCAEQMKVARTTVQSIYSEAREKLARALVEGRILCITGGNYELCEGAEDFCECGGCQKHRRRRQRMRQAMNEKEGIERGRLDE